MQMKGWDTQSWGGAWQRHGRGMAEAWRRGGSASNTVAMKNAGAISEFEAALLGLSQRTQQDSITNPCTGLTMCHPLVMSALPWVVWTTPERLSLFMGASSLLTTSTPPSTRCRDDICRSLIFQGRSQ